MLGWDLAERSQLAWPIRHWVVPNTPEVGGSRKRRGFRGIEIGQIEGGKSNTNVGVATMQSTPVVFSISPKVVSPGEIITVFGRTCMGDIWECGRFGRI